MGPGGWLGGVWFGRVGWGGMGWFGDRVGWGGWVGGWLFGWVGGRRVGVWVSGCLGGCSSSHSFPVALRLHLTSATASFFGIVRRFSCMCFDIRL